MENKTENQGRGAANKSEEFMTEVENDNRLLKYYQSLGADEIIVRLEELRSCNFSEGEDQVYGQWIQVAIELIKKGAEDAKEIKRLEKEVNDLKELVDWLTDDLEGRDWIDAHCSPSLTECFAAQRAALETFKKELMARIEFAAATIKKK